MLAILVNHKKIKSFSLILFFDFYPSQNVYIFRQSFRREKSLLESTHSTWTSSPRLASFRAVFINIPRPFTVFEKILPKICFFDFALLIQMLPPIYFVELPFKMYLLHSRFEYLGSAFVFTGIAVWRVGTAGVTWTVQPFDRQTDRQAVK